MALTALTGIAYGKPDGERVFVAEGERVPSGVFPKEVLQDLKDQGAVGEPPVAAAEVDAVEAENASLKEQVAALEEELAAAKKK